MKPTLDKGVSSIAIIVLRHKRHIKGPHTILKNVDVQYKRFLILQRT